MREPLRLFLILGFCSTISGTVVALTSHTRNAQLADRLDSIAAPTVASHDCTAIVAQKPLVLLALGQSNAGNHGALAAASPPVTLVVDGGCTTATDPLPGGTGSGGSIWSRLPALLSPPSAGRPVVLAILAVDASSIDEWTRIGSPLKRKLTEIVAAMNRQGLPADFVLWQQGEADARNGTSAADYASGLDRLAEILAAAGNSAPILVAKSTVCFSPAAAEIRAAIDLKTSRDRRFRSGPDTDSLIGTLVRRDGCHFNGNGLETAARMWATVIRSQAQWKFMRTQGVSGNEHRS